MEAGGLTDSALGLKGKARPKSAKAMVLGVTYEESEGFRESVDRQKKCWKAPRGAGSTKLVVVQNVPGVVESTQMVFWRVPGGAGLTKIVSWRVPGGV